MQKGKQSDLLNQSWPELFFISLCLSLFSVLFLIMTNSIRPSPVPRSATSTAPFTIKRKQVNYGLLDGSRYKRFFVYLCRL